MARENYTEIRENGTVSLADKYLVVDTRRDGYTRTFYGTQAFKVEQEGEEFYVYPTYIRPDGVLTNQKYPIIITDGDEVIFSVNTRIDPYNATEVVREAVEEGKDKQMVVLEAFAAVVRSLYAVGVYNFFIASEVGVQDDEVEFELTNLHEREVYAYYDGTEEAIHTVTNDMEIDVYETETNVEDSPEAPETVRHPEAPKPVDDEDVETQPYPEVADETDDN